MKKIECLLILKKRSIFKMLLLMKITTAFILLTSLQLSARTTYSQDRITIKLQSAELKSALKQIEKKSAFRFLYNDEVVSSNQKVSINAVNKLVTEVLDNIFTATPLTYHILENNLVVITQKNYVPQSVTVSGKVTGAAGEGLPGVSVRVKGTTAGTSTSAEGTYSLSVPDAATLVFSSVGFETQEVAVNGRTEINVVLTATNKVLDQVVVIGYGTQRRRDLTGSVTSVKGNEIARQPVQTATQAIQGKVAGVQVISSGEPNALPTVRLRGTGSTLGGANPLYVVDGILTDDIRNINTADIVTLDVLKDASATAIYGMRAANGVLIITTKKGRIGKNVFTYDANAGIREANNLVDMAGENQYAGYLNEASQYYGSGTVLIPPSSLTGANTDWYDAILRKAFQQNHNLSLSGGNEKINYFLSAGLLSEEGIQVKNKYSRFTIRSNNEYTFSTKLKLSTLVSYTRGDANGANFGAFSDAYRAAPYVPSKVGNQYGNTSLAGNVANPLLNIDKNYANSLGNRVQGNFALDYKPVAGLTLRTAIGVDLDYTKSTSYGYKFLTDTSTFVTTGGNQSQPNSNFSLTKNDASRWIWDNTATYTKTFGKHSITALGGVTSEQYKFNSIVGTAKDVPSNRDQWYLDAGTNGTQTVVNTGDKYTRNSYLGRLNYGYDSRYLLTATFRADGTSKFGVDNRWGYFPSIGLGWNISSEPFMTNQHFFDNLKLRGSYGKVGNDNIASALYYSIAKQNIPYYFNGGVFQGIAFDDLTDKNLKWEITDEYDMGLDFTILNKKLSGTVDYYSKKTSNALIYINIPGILGDPDNKYLTNASSISNKGVELSLTWNDKIGKNWTYSINGNVARNKNKIEKLNGGQPLIGDKVANYEITKTDNGQPIGSYFIREAIGVFQSEAEVAKSAQKDAKPGDLIYRDISGPAGIPDGIINEDYDRAYFGSYQPKITYGFNGNLAYKNFDLGISTYGTQGSKIYNGKKAARGSIQQTDNIEASVAKDRWTPNNTNSGVPRATLGAFPASTYFLETGDFFRLNNLSLGYTLPKNDNGRISSFRVYITAQNLFTITPYSGFTPEVQAAAGEKTNLNQGVDVNTYPSTRTFALGVNVSF